MHIEVEYKGKLCWVEAVTFSVFSIQEKNRRRIDDRLGLEGRPNLSAGLDKREIFSKLHCLVGLTNRLFGTCVIECHLNITI